jgi:hypothetical protein
VGAAKGKFFTSPYGGGVATYTTREAHKTEHNTVEQSETEHNTVEQSETEHNTVEQSETEHNTAKQSGSKSMVWSYVRLIARDAVESIAFERGFAFPKATLVVFACFVLEELNGAHCCAGSESECPCVVVIDRMKKVPCESV